MTVDDPRESSPKSEPLPAPGDGWVDLTTGDYAIYECTDCENLVVGTGTTAGRLTCHDSEMDRVRSLEIDVSPPDLRDTFQDAFDLPRAGLDICLALAEQGPLTAQEIAEELDYDRSTASRYLNALIDSGLVERTALNRAAGGIVHVYYVVELEQLRRNLVGGVCAWAGEAVSRLDDAISDREEGRTGTGPGIPPVFYEDVATPTADGPDP